MTLGSESSINAINGSEWRAVPLPKSFALKSMLHLHDLTITGNIIAVMQNFR